MSDIFGYIGALLIGLTLGLTGGGGSILTVPILVYIFFINPVTATAYSLFIVGTTSVFGAIHNYFKGLVDVKTGFLFAIPSFIAVYITRSLILTILPENLIKMGEFILTKSTFLMVFFALIMLLASYSMLKKKLNIAKIHANSTTLSLVIQNFCIGIIIGLVGAGGGFLIISSLVFFAQLPMKKAVGTSLFIIAMNSLIGFLGDVQNLLIDWLFLIKFTFISTIGIFAGIYLNKFINEKQLKIGFGYFVLIMACVILIKEIFFV